MPKRLLYFLLFLFLLSGGIVLFDRQLFSASPVPDTQYNADKNVPFGTTITDFSPQTGAVSVSSTDLTLPGRAGLDLAITRTYSSSAANLYAQGVSGSQSITTLATPLDRKYGLGSGWSFSFPFIDFNTDAGYERKSLFFGNGAVYTIQFTGNSNDSNLAQYPLKDLVISDGDQSYTRGGVESFYRLDQKDQTSFFFDANGNLLAIRDGAGRNEITFYYSESREGSAYPKLAHLATIQDPVGRDIIFAYVPGSDPLRLQSVTWTDPDGRYSRIVTYETEVLTGENPAKFVLKTVTDDLERRTAYEYSYDRADFRLGGTNAAATNVFANLTRTEQKVGAGSPLSQTVYEYNRPDGVEKTYTKVTELNGYIQYWRLTHREDRDMNGAVFNATDVTYDGEPYQNTEYSTTVSYANGTKETFQFNNDHVLVEREKRNDTERLFELTTTSYTDYRTPKRTEVYRGKVNDTSLVSSRDTDYDEFVDLRSETDAHGTVTRYTYDSKFHQLTSKKTANDSPVGEAFDLEEFFDIDSATGDVKNVYQTYGGSDELPSEPGNQMRRVTYTYDQYGNVLTEKDANEEDPNEYTITYSYDDQYHAYPKSAQQDVTDVDGVKHSLEVHTRYHNNGKVYWHRDEAGYVMSYEYDALWRPTKTIFPDVDDADPLAVDDGTWRASRTNNPSKQQVYDDASASVTTIDEVGRKSTQQQNGLGKEIAVIQYKADGMTPYASQSRAYDGVGNLASTTNEEENMTRFRYDGFNRQIEVMLADETDGDADNPRRLTEYLDQDLTTITTDTTGSKVEQVQDELGRLIEVREHNDGVVATTTYQYDDLGNRVEVKDAKGQTTTYAYQELQRHAGTTYPDGTSESFGYDDLGNLIIFVDRNGETTRSTYDERQKVLKHDYEADGFDEKFWYDSRGSLLYAEGEFGRSIDRTYDERGRLTRETSPIEGVTYTRTTAYDATGRATCIKYPTKTNCLDLQYDADSGLLKEMTDRDIAGEPRVAAYTYYKTGVVNTETSANGTATTLTVDSRNRPTRIQTAKGATTFVDLQYAFDGESNVTSITNRLSGDDRVSTFTYDDLHRLTSATLDAGIDPIPQDELSKRIDESFGVTLPTSDDTVLSDLNHDLRIDGRDLLFAKPFDGASDRTVAYTYDTAGNRLTSNKNGVQDEYTVNVNNQVTDIHESDGTLFHFEYDRNGNLIRKTVNAGQENERVWNYTWNQKNQLTNVYENDDPGTRFVEYRYDAVGRRREKVLTIGGGTQKTIYHYNANDALILETNLDGTQQRKYIHGVRGLVAQQTGNAPLEYVYTDHLGTPRSMGSTGGANVWSQEYYPFGEFLAGTSDGTSETTIALTGKLRDNETGLQYFGSRYYDPDLGRFISVDPAAPDYTNPQTLNRYVYTLNNPLKYIDPNGEFSVFGVEINVGTVAGCIVGGALGCAAGLAFDNFAPDSVKNPVYSVAVEFGALATAAAVTFYSGGNVALGAAAGGAVRGGGHAMARGENPLGILKGAATMGALSGANAAMQQAAQGQYGQGAQMFAQSGFVQAGPNGVSFNTKAGLSYLQQQGMTYGQSFVNQQVGAYGAQYGFDLNQARGLYNQGAGYYQQFRGGVNAIQQFSQGTMGVNQFANQMGVGSYLADAQNYARTRTTTAIGSYQWPQ
jgi:RHS repeat-associated protein